MLHISPLPPEEKQTVEAGQRNGKKAYFRDRCPGIVLRFAGFEGKELALIYTPRTRTIYDWRHRYEQDGFLGLKLKPGRGWKAARPGLTPAHSQQVDAQVRLNPQNLRAVAAVLSARVGVAMSPSALKGYLKKNQSTRGTACVNGPSRSKTRQPMRGWPPNPKNA